MIHNKLLLQKFIYIHSVAIVNLFNFTYHAHVIKIIYFSSTSDIVIVPPVDTQGLLSTVSIFYCERHGDLLDWTIEGTSINNDTKQERGIEIKTTMVGDSILSELRIIAKPINNDIGIGCNIVLFDPFITATKGATFQVLCISPVTNLQLNISENLLNTSVITLDPPSFSSDNDYHYNIIILK